MKYEKGTGENPSFFMPDACDLEANSSWFIFFLSVINPAYVEKSAVKNNRLQ